MTWSMREVKPVSYVERWVVVMVDGRCEPREIRQAKYPASPHAQELRDLMRERCLTLRGVATHMGVSLADVSALRNGGRSLTESEWRRLLDELSRLG